MATIAKIQGKTSTSYKAIIKQHGRILKTKTFKTKTAARAWAKRIEADQERLEAYGLLDNNMTFTELADEYMRQWSGKDKMRVTRVQWWCEHIGHYKLIDVTSQQIRDHLNAYLAGDAQRYAGIDEHMRVKTVSTGRKRSNASYNRHRVALSALFKYAVQQGYLTTNPVRNVPSKTESRGRVRYLSDSERERLLAACKRCRYDRMYLLVLMAITTGARRGELLGLRWCDIDFKKRIATLRTTKNGEKRILPLPTPTLRELLNYREVGEGYVFPSKLDPRKTVPLNKFWYDVLKDANIQNFRFHNLRHTAASYLVMNGATLYEAGEVLGHKSIQTTKRYAHLIAACDLSRA
jgi:integrase